MDKKIASCFVGLLCAALPALAATGLDWDTATPHQIALRCNGADVWRFRFDPAKQTKPYFDPVCVAGGPSLTWARPPDHVWHYGLWFSWKYINGLNYWEEKGGRAEGETFWDPPMIETQPDGRAVISGTFGYRPSGSSATPLLRERRSIAISAPDTEGAYCMDWTQTFAAGDVPVTLDRTPLSSEPGGQAWGGYAGLSLRFAQSFSNVETVASTVGRVPRDAFGRLDVTAGAAEQDGFVGGRPYGIAMLSHPSNPRAPGDWYPIEGKSFSYLNAAFLLKSAYTLKVGETLTLRYRVQIHPERWSAEDLRLAIERYVASAGAADKVRVLRPAVGAIRWDAWSGGGVTKQVEKTLGPKKYHYRLPWFAQIDSNNTVRIDGSRQAVMGQEIDYAAEAGLDYWAFLLYPEAESMSVALKQYLANAKRGRINFCLILHNTFGVSDDQWPRERERAVALLKEPGYQTVVGGRPLIYAFGVNGDRAGARLAEFRQATTRAGMNPYLVYMGWNPAADYARETTNGFDAVSAYAYGSAQATFAQLAESVEKQYWQQAAQAHVPYVPLVTTGWDKWPRKEHPVSWEMSQGYHKQEVFPATARPEEIAAHLEHAIDFVRDHADICVAKAVILYAWNEHDEGGWLVPTWTPGGKPDTARLDALRKVLSPVRLKGH